MERQRKSRTWAVRSKAISAVCPIVERTPPVRTLPVGLLRQELSFGNGSGQALDFARNDSLFVDVDAGPTRSIATPCVMAGP